MHRSRLARRLRLQLETVALAVTVLQVAPVRPVRPEARHLFQAQPWERLDSQAALAGSLAHTLGQPAAPVVLRPIAVAAFLVLLAELALLARSAFHRLATLAYGAQAVRLDRMVRAGLAVLAAAAGSLSLAVRVVLERQGMVLTGYSVQAVVVAVLPRRSALVTAVTAVTAT